MNTLLKSDDLTLVVGDVHISAAQNLSRGRLLGKAIADLKPSRVVYIGDLLTFDSLSAWDKDKRKKMEGRRYQKDIDAGKRFLALVDDNGGHKCSEYILTEGNHENRLCWC